MRVRRALAVFMCKLHIIVYKKCISFRFPNETEPVTAENNSNSTKEKTKKKINGNGPGGPTAVLSQPHLHTTFCYYLNVFALNVSQQ